MPQLGGGPGGVQEVESGGAGRVGHPGKQGPGGEPPGVEADAVDAGEPDRPQPGQVRVVVTDEREPPGHVDVHLRGGRPGTSTFTSEAPDWAPTQVRSSTAKIAVGGSELLSRRTVAR